MCLKKIVNSKICEWIRLTLKTFFIFKTYGLKTFFIFISIWSDSFFGSRELPFELYKCFLDIRPTDFLTTDGLASPINYFILRRHGRFRAWFVYQVLKPDRAASALLRLVISNGLNTYRMYFQSNLVPKSFLNFCIFGAITARQ